jgi:nicotinamide-nucleotide amidase
MEPMLLRHVLPALRRLSRGAPRARTEYVSCCGVPESVVAERIADLMERGRGVRVGTAVGEGVITVSVHGAGDEARRVPAVHREVLRRLGADAYAPDRSTPGENLVRLLLERRLTVSAAESCTAGLVAARLTDLPGSSGAFLGGVVAYANDVKASALGVPRAILEGRGAPGAVSGPVAEAMARGVRERTGSDVAVSVTGIAGPGGATRDKPVGRVWIGVATRDGVRSHERTFGGDRAFLRGVSANHAIDLLRRAVEGQAAPPG